MRYPKTINTDIILLLLFSIFGVNNILSHSNENLVLFLLLILVPGFYISKIVFSSELYLFDLLASSVILSVILETIIYIYMITSGKYSYKNLIFINIIVLTILCYFSQYKSTSIKNPSISDTLFLFWIIFTNLLVVSLYLPESFWDGWDPWINHYISQLISETLISPGALQKMYQEKLNVQISGFYYLLSYLHVVSGVNLYYINRYFSFFINCGICYLMYSLLRDKVGRFGGVIFSLAFYLNDFTNQRFSMVLRENFAVLLFIYLIWFLKKEIDIPKRGIILVLVFSIIIMFHHLVSLLCLVYLFINIFFSDSYTNEIYDVCFFIIALFISYPISINYYRIVEFYINNSYMSLSLIFISAVGFIAALYFKNKYLGERIYRKYFFLGLWFLTSYSLLFKQYEQSVWTHFQIAMMSYFTLNTSLLLFYRYEWNDNNRVDDLLFAVMILMQAPLMGVNLPIFRLSTYIDILGSYYCILFFQKLYKHGFKGFLEADIYINLREVINWEYSYIKKIRSSVIIILLVLLIQSPFIYHDLSPVYGHNARMNYLPEELREAELFLGNLTERDLVAGDHRDLTALWYYKVEPDQIAENEVYSRLLVEGYDKELVSLLSKSYPWADRLVVFNFKFKRVNRNICYSFVEYNNVTELETLFLEVYYLDL